MSWDSTESSQLGVDEVGAGSGADGPWITLNANEMCHYTVVRTDGLAGDRWLVDIIPSLNQSRADNPPFRRYIMESDELIKSLRIFGFFSFRIHIGNAETAPSDQVETDHYWKKNGVNL